jgi:two-component system sensor histidine kinase QseC
MWFPDFGRFSLRGRLALMLLLGLGLTMSVGFLGLHYLVREQIYDTAWVRLENRRVALAEFAAIHPGGESAADEMLEFRSNAHEDYFEIRDGGLRLLARSESSAGRDLDQPPASSASDPVRYRLLLPDGHSGIATRGSTLLPPGDPRVSLITIVAQETESIAALEARIHTAMLAVALSALLAGIVATLVAIRRGLRPVDQLARSAEMIDPDGPRRALEVGQLPRELATLGEKLDLLMRRLFDARDRERRLNRSIAHELRTPLAEVRMIADVGARSASPEEARSALREVSASAEELQRIVDTLMALARYDSGQETPQPEPINLAAEVRRQLARLAVNAEERSLTIQAMLPHERWIMADTALMRRLLANLIGNAVAHAPAGATLSVSMGVAGPLRISNPAPHLSHDDLEHLGERFYSVDSGDGGAHAGLGLPLAMTIARLSHLRLGLGLDDEQNLTATVDAFRALPAMQDEATVQD